MHSSLHSAFTGCAELVLSHLFCSRQCFAVQQLSEGKKQALQFCPAVPLKKPLYAISGQAEGYATHRKEYRGREERRREYQRISQSSL